MVFSAITFLFCFLPIVLIVDRLLPWRLKNGFLFAASLVFYTWGAGSLVLILLGSMAVNFVAGTAVERAVDGGRRTRARWVLALAVTMNLALLGWFKYANFAAQQAGGILRGRSAWRPARGPPSCCPSASRSTRSTPSATWSISIAGPPGTWPIR